MNNKHLLSKVQLGSFCSQFNLKVKAALLFVFYLLLTPNLPAPHTMYFTYFPILPTLLCPLQLPQGGQVPLHFLLMMKSRYFGQMKTGHQSIMNILRMGTLIKYFELILMFL